MFLDDAETRISEVPLTPATTCGDVIAYCKEPGEEECHLAELWRGCGEYLSLILSVLCNCLPNGYTMWGVVVGWVGIGVRGVLVRDVVHGGGRVGGGMGDGVLSRW